MRKTKNYLNRDFKKKRSADALSIKRRSELMARVRSKSTQFEKDFIFALRKSISRNFKTNVASIKGKPDIVFPKEKVCVFLDSDFWHGWYYPRWKHLLKNDFWRKKIEDNRRRDKKTTAYLRKNDWIVLRFWEHLIRKDTDGIIKIIKRRLKK
jgi:DNA mismatch endonuclease (patch repair protein)